jgi:predicted DsbA family dithiol-disulfide isomerase
VLIEIYADVLCAWAFVSKLRLHEAVQLMRGQDEAPTVVWRPYLIDPMAPTPTVDLGEALSDPVVGGALQQCTPGISAAENQIRVRDIALAEGIGPRFGARWRASSWAAHRLIDAAIDCGPDVQDEVVETILHAHFVIGEDINSLSFLGPLATRFDLPPPVAGHEHDGALAYMEPGFDPADPSERRTRESYLAGMAMGVRSSPTFFVNGHSVLTGAQSPENLAWHIIEAAKTPATRVPEEINRIRLAQALLDSRRDPRGCLYLLAPLRPQYDGERNLEILTARALAASASLEPARDKLERLVKEYPDDAYLHLLLGKTLRRLRDGDSARHLAIAKAMEPDCPSL